MSTTPFAQSLSDARLMADAVRAHEAELKAVSLGSDMSDELSALAKEMEELDTAQEKLKADLKKATSALNAKSARLCLLLQDCRRRVKIAIDKDGWKEFGISAKK